MDKLYTKDIFNEYFSKISLESKLKDWLRFQFKYGTSCPYCGAIGRACKECMEQI